MRQAGDAAEGGQSQTIGDVGTYYFPSLLIATVLFMFPQFTLAESERKYDDIARKLHGKEEEMQRSEERCEMCEKKIIDLEEELRVVGQNLQQLEVSEEKALQREENYQNQLKSLMDSLKAAENREENAIMNIQRLNIRIDQVRKRST